MTSVPFFSASGLISEANDETYGRNKFVSDKERNQNLLVLKIEEKLKEHSHIFLDGHFCIFRKGNIPDPLPLDNLEQMHFEKILLLEADPEIILKNLSNRDNKHYTLENIKKLMETEHQQAKTFSEKTRIPLYIHQMQFDDTDALKLFSFL